jgi:hypothetical protein
VALVVVVEMEEAAIATKEVQLPPQAKVLQVEGHLLSLMLVVVVVQMDQTLPDLLILARQV